MPVSERMPCGTAPTSRLYSVASRVVILVPDRMVHSTAMTSSASPTMIRLRAGKDCFDGRWFGGSSESSVPPFCII